MKYKLRLRDLPAIMGEKLDMEYLLREVAQYKVPKKNKGKDFVNAYEEMLLFTTDFMDKYSLDEEFVVSSTNTIKSPVQIDAISYVGTLELQSLRASSSDLPLEEFVKKFLGLACFEANHKGENLDNESDSYKAFEEKIFNSDLIEMLSMYKYLDKLMEENQKFWSQKFFEVSSPDPDYTQAGGDRMNAFNVIETLEAMCSRFNVSHKEAWHIPYNMVQASNLAKATQSDIQSKMSDIKEAKAKQKQRIT